MYFESWESDAKIKEELKNYSGLKQPQVTDSLILLDALKTQSLEVGSR